MISTLAFVVAISLGNAPGSQLFPVERAGYFGFADYDGKLAIRPRFDAVKPFSEKLAAVRDDEKWGYIDTDGDVVIEPRYEVAKEFREGLAPVKLFGEGYVFVDRKGAPAFDSTFLDARPFSDGLAAVRTSKGWGFIDTTGRYPKNLHDRFEAAGSFAKGLAPVVVEGLWGYIQRDGDFRIPPTFLSARSIVGDYTVARPYVMGAAESARPLIYHTPETEQLALLTTDLDETITELGDFVDGIAPARAADDWGYVDLQGRWQVVARFEHAAPFRGGLARVVDPTGRSYYIDSEGTVAFPASDRRLTSSRRTLIPLHYESSPTNAEVYLLSKRTYERHPELKGDFSRWTSAGVPTDGVEQVFEKKYKIAFVLGNRTILKEVDVLKDKKNMVHANFD